MPQDYTPELKKKNVWDDKDLISITSFKGANLGDAGGSYAEEKTTVGEFKVQIGGGPGLPTFIEDRTEDEGQDFTVIHNLNLTKPNNIIVGVINNGTGFSQSVNVLLSSANGVMLDLPTGGAAQDVAITIIGII
jgi:hypothetical protein